MKCVILAGGLGNRLDGDNPDRIPKPLTTIGGIPIIEHIMNIYSSQGINEFILCLGYKGNLIKEYFQDYYLNNYNMQIDLNRNFSSYYYSYDEKKKWKIDLIDTGLNTATGRRIKRVQSYLEQDEPFMLTYGDGLADIDLDKLLKFHKSHGRLVTITTVQPKGSFGVIELDSNGKVINFQEKPIDTNTYINAGFMVVEPEALNYIDNENDCWWEKDILSKLTKLNQVMAYKHLGEFKAMDSPKDKKELEEMWNSGNAFWDKK